MDTMKLSKNEMKKITGGEGDEGNFVSNCSVDCYNSLGDKVGVVTLVCKNSLCAYRPNAVGCSVSGVVMEWFICATD